MRILTIIATMISIFLHCHSEELDANAALSRGQALENNCQYIEAGTLYQSALEITEDKQQKLKLLHALAMVMWIAADGSLSNIKNALKYADNLSQYTNEHYGVRSKEHLNSLILFANMNYDAANINECTALLNKVEGLVGFYKNSDVKYFISITEQSIHRRSFYEDRANIIASLLALTDIYAQTYGDQSKEYLRHVLRVAKQYTFTPDKVTDGIQLCNTVIKITEDGKEVSNISKYEALLVLAELHVAAQNYGAAESLYKQVLVELQNGSAFQRMRYGYGSLIEFYIKAKQIDKARSTWDEANAAMKLLPEGSPFMKTALLRTSLLLQIADESNVRLQRDLEYVNTQFSGDSEKIIKRRSLFLLMIVRESLKLGIGQRTLPVIEEAKRLTKMRKQAHNKELIELLDLQAGILRNLGRPDEAHAIEEEARTLRE